MEAPTPVRISVVTPSRLFRLPTIAQRHRWDLAPARRKQPSPPWSGSNGDGHQPIADHATIDLVLYVSRSSLGCGRARVTLERLINQFPAGTIELQIVDVAEHPAAAARDRILFTPTLLLIDHTARVTRLLGDLSNADVLMDVMRAAGVEPI